MRKFVSAADYTSKMQAIFAVQGERERAFHCGFHARYGPTGGGGERSSNAALFVSLSGNASSR